MASKQQVLVIENNSALKQYYTNNLIKLGLEPIVVPNGTEALRTLKSSIDGDLKLVVMGWHIPDVHGYLIAQKVRSDPKFLGVEFLICASDLAEEDRFLMQELDIAHTLPKGASTQQIVDKVKAIQIEIGKKPALDKRRVELEGALNAGQPTLVEDLLAQDDLKKDVFKNPKYAHLAGEVEIMRKKYEDALAFLKGQMGGALDFDAPLNPLPGASNTLKCANAYAKALCYLGRYDEAEGIYARLSAKSPKNLSHIVSQADALLGQDKVDEARVKYTAVLAQDSTQKDALIGMGKSHLVRGEIDKAHEVLGRVEGGYESASFASFFNNRAIALIHAGRIEEGIALFENALKFIKRDRFPVMFNMGMAYLRLKKAPKAVEIFEQVLDTCRADFISKKSILQKLQRLGREKFIEAYGKGLDDKE